MSDSDSDHAVHDVTSMSRGDGRRRAGSVVSTASLPVASALLVTAVLAGGWNYRAGQRAQFDVRQQRSIISRSDRLISTLKDLEIGERGYALTGRAEYLDPYVSALSRIDKNLDDVDALDTKAAGAAAALRPVRGLVSQEKAFFGRVVSARREKGADAAAELVSTGEGRRLINAIDDAKRDADERAAAETSRIEDADRLRSLVLNLVVLASVGAAVILLARLSLVRRRESQISRRTLDDVLGNAPVGLGFIGRDLKLRHVNRSLSDMGGIGLRASVGAPIWAGQPDLEVALTPPLQAAFDRGVITPDVHVQINDASASGRTRHLRMGLYPLGHAHGARGYESVGVAVVDLTDAKLSEERIRAGEALLRTVLDSLPVGVLIAEAPSGRIADRNARAEEILGHGVLPSIEDDGPLRWVAFHEDGNSVSPAEWPLNKVVHGGAMLAELEVDYQRGDGRRSWIDFTAVQMRDAGDQLIGAVVVVADIDARKRTEQVLAAARDAAEQASRAKSTFLANMSHELRTPLSAIIGYSEMMLEEIDDGAAPADMSSDVRRIEGNARHLLGLINDVLDLSKVESGKMEIFAETFAVEPMLRDIAATVGSLVSKKSNRLELRAASDLGTMHSDLTKVRQVLLNLIGNAAKFTENGVITLAASRQSIGNGEQLLTFSVSDTGIGMTAEQVSKLFQRFTQADASTTRKFGGTGLGLSLAKAFTDMLAGSVAVESVPDQGSTFTLHLPAAYVAAEETKAESVEGSAIEISTNGRDLVLVIDDDADQRLLLSRFLEREGFAVQVAPDGSTGLEAARRSSPRAILLDVMMPGVDGWSVLSELKSDPKLAAIPVVMVTSTNEHNLAASLGAADYMLKPVRWDRLSQVMDRFRTPEGGILLVEDDVVLRSHVRSLLEEDGWMVAEAGDGHEGLREATARRPEVVLLDLNMPVMDGFDFLKEFRLLPGCEEIPVVVLTAKDLTREDRGLLRGASQVLNKGDTSLRSVAERLRDLARIA